MAPQPVLRWLAWVTIGFGAGVLGCASSAETERASKGGSPAPAQKSSVQKSAAIPPGSPLGGIRPGPGEAFFEMDTLLGDRFIFKLVDAGRIKDAREIIEKKLPKRVVGIVVKTAQPYNRPWHFHFDPKSIGFSYLTDESCDAAIQYLEDHLHEIGDRVLPQSRWCPASSRLVREVSALDTGR